VLLRDGRVLTDDEGRLPSYVDDHPWSDLARRARVSGDPDAVLLAPQVEVRADPQILLSVFGSRAGAGLDGTWRTLDELVEDDAGVVTALRDVAVVVDDIVAAPAGLVSAGWYDEVEAWIDQMSAANGRSRTGATVAVKVWSLSAVLRVPCDPAPLWFKASCRHFHAEPALTRLVVEMLPAHAPRVVAADEDRAWLLMDEMPGADEEHEEGPSVGLGPAAARIVAALQLRSLDHLGEIEAVGVPVRGLTETLHGFDEILTGSVELDALTAEELAAARGRRDEVHHVFDELAALGLPETLVHGDLHPGNVSHHGDTVMLYDWSDAAVAHPFLDAAHLTRSIPEKERDETRETYAELWRAAYPGVDVDRGLELAGQVNSVYQMVTFEQICRAIEDASSWEMSGVVARYLKQLPERFRGTS
jgi:aminoglycoside phosphotransferase (APT) family kinase protein